MLTVDCLAIIEVILAVGSKSRTSLVVLGILALVGGVVMLMHHKRRIDEVMASGIDSRGQLFEQRLFRRRSLASAMIAAMGILMIALKWAREPGAFFGLITIVLLLLIAAMFVAFLDLMSVSLNTVTKSTSVRQETLDEYLRQRKTLLDQSDDSDPGEDV